MPLSVQAADGSWSNICNPGPDGRRQTFPLAGRARADATIAPAAPGAFEITCTGGAQGKCVRFGHYPWNAVHDGPSYDLYDTCVRMVRADYAGDGRGTTRDGQSIDLYDRFFDIQNSGQRSLVRSSKLRLKTGTARFQRMFGAMRCDVLATTWRQPLDE